MFLLNIVVSHLCLQYHFTLSKCKLNLCILRNVVSLRYVQVSIVVCNKASKPISVSNILWCNIVTSHMLIKKIELLKLQRKAQFGVSVFVLTYLFCLSLKLFQAHEFLLLHLVVRTNIHPNSLPDRNHFITSSSNLIYLSCVKQKRYFHVYHIR